MYTGHRICRSILQYTASIHRRRRAFTGHLHLLCRSILQEEYFYTSEMCVYNISGIHRRRPACIQATCTPYMQLRILQENNLMQEEYFCTGETCVYNRSSIHRTVYRPLGSNMHLKTKPAKSVHTVCSTLRLCSRPVSLSRCSLNASLSLLLKPISNSYLLFALEGSKCQLNNRPDE